MNFVDHRFSFKDYFKLIKLGIVVFSLLSASAGYVLAVLTVGSKDDFVSLPYPFFWLILGLYFLVSGGFILNQVSEWKKDALMHRTKNRPIPLGKIKVGNAVYIGVIQVILGSFILLALKPLTAFLALLALLLYNVFYTFFWKKSFSFAAVPGALPGALPVMIGYSAVSSSIFSIQCLYLFFVLFLWQMPHFWSLALHYKKDYQRAGFPVLPLKLGLDRTLYYIGVYLLFYIGLVLISPFIFKMGLVYLLLLIPFCLKISLEFMRFSKQLKWKPFFMWLNISVLVFLWAPALDMLIYFSIWSEKGMQ